MLMLLEKEQIHLICLQLWVNLDSLALTTSLNEEKLYSNQLYST